jgi:hypothetical protein
MKPTESTSTPQAQKHTQPEEFDLVILGGGTGSTVAAPGAHSGPLRHAEKPPPKHLFRWHGWPRRRCGSDRRWPRARSPSPATRAAAQIAVGPGPRSGETAQLLDIQMEQVSGRRVL